MGFRDAATATADHRASLDERIATELASIEALSADYDEQVAVDRAARDERIVRHKLAIESLEAELATLPPA